ncbi:MAG TPA: hypothetical protein VJT68_07415 [Thermoleophilaceae bacterium]|nr:hypothetical protein [Thermoleophilaceae bacterium]
MRPSADALVESVLVLRTMGAPERRSLFPARLGRSRPRRIESAEPEPVPTSRATIARAVPFGDADEAAGWLASADLHAELDAAVAVLNRALHAHRVATADPYLTEVSASRALVARVGYGSGEEVADGRFGDARELPVSGRGRPRRSMEAPEERFAALLGGREEVLPAEELVLRARADLNAGRLAEAALQARVAIEALLAAQVASEDSGAAGGSLGTHREAIGAAANAALRGDMAGDAAATLDEAVAAMELALKRRRLGA